MTVATGYRPRSYEQHLRLANAMVQAPARVMVDHADDGWACAHLAVCGRQPLWASTADPRPVERALLRLGLPGLAGGTSNARLGHDLRLRGGGRPQRIHTGAYSPIDILTTVSGTWSEAREHLRGLVGRGDVLVVDRTEDPRVRSVLDRMPGVVTVELPGASQGEAFARAVELARNTRSLILPEQSQLMPGGLAVLDHALGRSGQPGVALGDQLVLDADGHLPIGLIIAPRLPDTRGREVLDVLRDNCGPVLLDRTLPLDVDALREAPSLHAWLADLAVQAPVVVAPVWASARTGPAHLASRTGAPRQHLALVPESCGTAVVVDDGDDGALGETLARLPPCAHASVLRAVPDAVEPDLSRHGVWLGGYGDLVQVEDGPWSVRLTSDPAWTPPPLQDTELLDTLDLDLPSAVYAVAAVLGWPLPLRRRAVGRARWHNTALLAADARAALDQGDRSLARTLTRALAAATDDWAGAALLASEVEGATLLGSAR